MALRHILSVFLLLTYNTVQQCTSSVVHSHNTEHNKERESDGSYRPRDADHYNEGVHNQEFDHEAILGSVKDAMEFEKLTAAESQERLAKMLPEMDLNKDQSIDKNELKTWILNSFLKLSKEEAEERLNEIDTNQDGMVTWKEYSDDFKFDADEFDLEEDSGELGLKQDKTMWETADLDGDGALNAEEFETFLHPEEHSMMYPMLVNQTFKDKDENRDGKLDFHEYIGETDSRPPDSWLLSEREKFDDLDLDKDGILNQDEVQRWVIPNNEEIAEEEVEHLFSSADDDRNNMLSFEEIVRHHDVFVGSEAYSEDSMPKHFDDEL